MTSLLDLTADFKEFTKKMTPLFGDIKTLSKINPDVYSDVILCHGFLEYVMVKKIHGNIKERIKTEKGFYDSGNPEHDKLYDECLKNEYLKWAKKNKLPEHLVERGWERCLNEIS